MQGPRNVVESVQEHLLAADEPLIGVILDNSFVIETGGTGQPGSRYRGDKTAQRLAQQFGFDLEERVPCAVIALTEDRLVGAPWPIKGPGVEFDVPSAGVRLRYAENAGFAATRVYAVIELGDGRFTTFVVQTKAFGMAAGKTKAGLDAIVAGLGDVERVDLP